VEELEERTVLSPGIPPQVLVATSDSSLAAALINPAANQAGHFTVAWDNGGC
jgi:hypothetical protein